MDDNMEFEENKPTSDEDRRLAEGKKLTLQPLHDDVTADSMPDSVIVARHMNEPAIANISIDIEESHSLIQPTESILRLDTQTSPQARKLFASMIAGATTFIILSVIAFLQ
jgi:hypothetical protein